MSTNGAFGFAAFIFLLLSIFSAFVYIPQGSDPNALATVVHPMFGDDFVIRGNEPVSAPCLSNIESIYPSTTVSIELPKPSQAIILEEAGDSVEAVFVFTLVPRDPSSWSDESFVHYEALVEDSLGYVRAELYSEMRRSVWDRKLSGAEFVQEDATALLLELAGTVTSLNGTLYSEALFDLNLDTTYVTIAN